MAMTLRPYQAEARDAILQEWEQGRKRTLLVLPTGCGKTVVFSKVAEDRVNRGGRVLVMAHRGELLDQAADKIRQVTGIECAYEKATKEAQAMLRKAGRPVCRRDMLTAMDSAIMTRVASFEKKADMANAALLLATIICKNILTDGPLHEGD